MIRPTQFTFLLLIFMPLAVVAGEGLGIGDRVEFSGFGRLVAGYLDEGNDVTFSGYGDSISVDEQSLLGVQLDVKLSDSLSLTSQLLAHSAETRDSGVEWLYLTYEASPRLTFRVGKQRTPFYNYSDVLDVGFAYPWITPPEGVYNEYQISSYDGINARYTSSIGNFVYTIEGYWGSNNEELVAGGDTFEPEFNDLRGIIFNVRMDEWSARASINDARTTLDLPGLQGLVDALSGAGFVNSANSLKANGAPKFYHASLKYENLDWLIEAEYNGVQPEI